ncbi:biopolymer transporter ExbD [Pedobacter aquatilis]|uniref:ExbD/TolR family protein n=1 Tax=Pedobacter aquatilis TaxID=351343 RepID=UPI00292FBAF4|nr:biopolymer transporter ExbD [Pedobacter aquatilis]
MATIEISKSGKAANGRTQKTAPRVDLTAMVDLMFLLTTFFMLTTSLSELKAADIAKPVNDDVPSALPASRTMTILLGKNDQVVYYMGETDQAVLRRLPINVIAETIIANKLAVAKLYQNNPAKFMIVVVKPTKDCSYKNLVDLIDDLKIADVKSYSIDDENLILKETDFLKSKL